MRKVSFLLDRSKNVLLIRTDFLTLRVSAKVNIILVYKVLEETNIFNKLFEQIKN